MQNIKSIVSVVLLITILWSVQSCKTKIDVSKYELPANSNRSKYENANVKLSISIIETGFATAPEAFVFRGGSWFKTRRLSHVAVLVQHPKATFVFDTGLGSEIEGQFQGEFSFLDRQAFKFSKINTLYEILSQHDYNPDSIDFIIPSHLHFDHASGIEDFPNATVLTSKEEYEHAMSENATPPAFIKKQYDSPAIRWEFLDFDGMSYEVFKNHHDVFADGTVILVKLPGHTKGSLGMFISLKSGKRYFFTGDLTWAKEGFLRPSEKHAIPRGKVDGDREKVKESIVKIYQLIKQKPEINIIPAHDYEAQKQMAHFPNVEY